MQITEQHREIITNVVKANSRFSGNEDLLEAFCGETLRRAYNVISSIDDVNTLEQYLKKVANSAIIEVLRTNDRIKSAHSGYKQAPITKEIPSEPVNIQLPPMEQKIEPVAPVKIQNSNNYNNPIYEIPDPKPNIEEPAMSDEEIKEILEVLKELDSKDAEKKYSEIFNERYLNNQNQMQIAQKLNITQGDVSKRLVKISHEINIRLNED